MDDDSVEMQCGACGERVVIAGQRPGDDAMCPTCGARLAPPDEAPERRIGESTRPFQRKVKPDTVDGGTTLFQPSIMVGSILEEDDGTPPDAWLHPRGKPGQRFPLHGKETTLGREGAHIVLDDPAVSSLHCQIEVVGNELYVRDLGSSNGTFLNGHRVRHSQILSGDELLLGRSSLILRTGEGEG